MRLKLVLGLIIIIVVPLLIIYNNINKKCIQAASEAVCDKLNFKEKLNIFVKPEPKK